MARKRRDVPWLDKIDGWYYACWYAAEARRTKRISLRTSNDGEAKTRFAAFLVEGGDIYRPGDGQGLTVAKALDDYFEEHVKAKVVDQDRIGYAITHLKAYFAATAVPAIDIPRCRGYVAARQTGAVVSVSKAGEPRLPGDGTVRRELGVLVAAINHAVRWKRLKRDEAPEIELPPPPKAKALWLFPDELAALRAAATGRTYQFIEIAYYTAGRRRSVETLTKFQVSLDRNRVNLSRPEDPTTKKRRPVVPIDPALLPTLRECLNREKNPTEYVLGHPGSVRKGFETALRRAGLEMLSAREGRPVGKPTPHTLRHTRATHLLQAGVDPWAVAGLLGDSLATVLANYGHHCPDYLSRALGAPAAKESGA